MIGYLIGGGFVLLLVGGDLLVRGASNVAHRLGVSPLLIGLTIVGFGTSTPELVTSVQAAIWNSPGISIGNVVGSNIINILLILGLTALLSPIVVERKGFVRDAVALVISAAALCYVAYTGGLTVRASEVFLGLLAVYVVFAYVTERRTASADEVAVHPIGASLILIALGLAGTIFGARLLVQGAIALAREAGLSESFIGLTIVAATGDCDRQYHRQ